MSVFKECDTPQVLDSHNTTATEGSCTNEPSNEPQELCVDEVQSGSDRGSSSVASDNSTLAEAENIDNSRICSHKTKTRGTATQCPGRCYMAYFFANTYPLFTLPCGGASCLERATK